MKNYIFFLVFICPLLLFAFSSFNGKDKRIGGTQLNGDGCVCHTVEQSLNVKVWVTGSDTLIAGQTGLYKMFLTGGPAIAGGYNVAGRFGTMNAVDSLTVWDYRAPNELTQAFPLLFPSTSDTIFWEFGYTASDSSSTDTIYSTGLSVNYDGIPSEIDEWAYGSKFPVTVIQNAIPVELISFDASNEDNRITLTWKTATEINNYGFEIERSVGSLQSSVISQFPNRWEKIGFVKGNGSSSIVHRYFFVDYPGNNSVLKYRLRQVDYSGSFKFSNTLEVSINNPISFSLEQNYPNPFNPTTKIRYSVPSSETQSSASSQHVLLKVYDIPGNEISTLVNEKKEPGHYQIEFNGMNLTSGIYFYKLQIEENSIVRKMVLLR